METHQDLINVINAINAKGKDDLITWSLITKETFNPVEFEDYGYIEIQNRLTKAETDFLIKYIQNQPSVTDYCKVVGDTIFIGAGSQIFTIKLWDRDGNLDFEVQATLLLTALLKSSKLKLKIDSNQISILTTVGTELLHIKIPRGESFRTYASFMNNYIKIESVEAITDSIDFDISAKNIVFSATGATELNLDSVGVPSIKHCVFYIGKEPVAFNIPTTYLTKATRTMSIQLLEKKNSAHMIRASLPKMQIFKMQLNQEVSKDLAKIHESLILL